MNGKRPNAGVIATINTCRRVKWVGNVGIIADIV